MPRTPPAPARTDEELLNEKHRRLMGRLVEFLEERGRRLAPAQERLVHVFLLAEGHRGADELLDALRIEFPEASMSEVKATLGLLMETGVARSFLAGLEPVYEHGHLSEHHDHLVCVKCGAIQEFLDDDIERRQTLAAEKVGFRPFFHSLTIHGLCGPCREATGSFKPLSQARVGERVRIESIRGGNGLIRRLADMGLTRGMEAEVVSNGGSVRLMVRGSRVAIGSGMASRVFVASAERAPKEDKDTP